MTDPFDIQQERWALEELLPDFFCLCPRCDTTSYRRKSDGAVWCFICQTAFYTGFLSFLKNEHGVELCELPSPY